MRPLFASRELVTPDGRKAKTVRHVPTSEFLDDLLRGRYCGKLAAVFPELSGGRRE